MLTDGEIAAMRGVANQALPDTAVLSSSGSVSDGAGGVTEGWTGGGTFSCRISPVSGGEGSTRGDRIADESTHIITFPAETVITEANRVTIGGIAYEVTLVRERGEWELTRRVEAREVP